MMQHDANLRCFVDTFGHCRTKVSSAGSDNDSDKGGSAQRARRPVCCPQRLIICKSIRAGFRSPGDKML